MPRQLGRVSWQFGPWQLGRGSWCPGNSGGVPGNLGPGNSVPAIFGPWQLGPGSSDALLAVRTGFRQSGPGNADGVPGRSDRVPSNPGHGNSGAATRVLAIRTRFLATRVLAIRARQPASWRFRRVPGNSGPGNSDMGLAIWTAALAVRTGFLAIRALATQTGFLAVTEISDSVCLLSFPLTLLFVVFFPVQSILFCCAMVPPKFLQCLACLFQVAAHRRPRLA